MNNKFDELTKGLAQSVTRRGALKKFGFGLAAIVLATLGLVSKTDAHPPNKKCRLVSPTCPDCCNAPTFNCDKVYADPTMIQVCISGCYRYCQPA